MYFQKVKQQKFHSTVMFENLKAREGQKEASKKSEFTLSSNPAV